jgi:hypothetical protein
MGRPWKDYGRTQKAIEVFDLMYAFATESDRARIRGLNAAKLFKF